MLIQIILVVSLALALVMTWRRARQDVIANREALAWSVLWVAAAIVVLLPGVTSWLASLVGVGRGVDLVVYASVVALFMLVFKLFIQHQRLERNLTDLVRREALRDLDRPKEDEPKA
ncbi:DUF2304 domain-containing protein [Patescibacteria group bacterium]|nr:DUF2304 domain-containing protein [Patescibacteria group bacterium]MBU2613221.1 DUF2304 domain-containing protein [Patescibacteria group bacterium]